MVVDDSIMRGTTYEERSSRCSAMPGQKKFMLRISAPPTKFPCYYGIDIPTHSELIAATHTIEEIRKYLRVDSISYLTTDTLIKAVDSPSQKFCTACFDGYYPCRLDDVNDNEDNLKFQFDEGNGLYY